MTRQMQIHKWTVYGLALLLVFLLEVALLAQFPISGVCPLLLPLAATAVAVLEGGHDGAYFGMAAGILWAGAATGGHGMHIFFLTIVGLLAGISAQYVLNQGFLSYLLCAAVTLLVLSCCEVGVRLFIRFAPLTQLLPIATTQLFYSLAFTPLVYLLFKAVFNRVGGTKLA